jgi:hypothetical protein
LEARLYGGASNATTLLQLLLVVQKRQQPTNYCKSGPVPDKSANGTIFLGLLSPPGRLRLGRWQLFSLTNSIKLVSNTNKLDKQARGERFKHLPGVVEENVALSGLTEDETVVLVKEVRRQVHEDKINGALQG